MTKQLIFISLLIATTIICFSCLHKGYQKQGILSVQYYHTNFVDTFEMKWPASREYKIWFKDSCVIYENKSEFGSTTVTANGELHYTAFLLFKYTYLNLKTMIAQDYYNLSDTAEPRCNYQLKPNESISWIFYPKQNPLELTGVLTSLPDTMMNGRHLKVIKLFYGNTIRNDVSKFFLDCNMKNNIFHLNSPLDKMYTPCKTIRKELTSSYDPSLYTSALTMLQKKLSPDEKKIFAQWSKNAERTTLPVLTWLQSGQQCFPSPKTLPPGMGPL